MFRVPFSGTRRMTDCSDSKFLIKVPPLFRQNPCAFPLISFFR